MAVPSASDFNKWSGTKFTNTDWDQNVDKTVEILANGNYDLNVAQVTATSYVGIPSDQFSTITAGENLTAGDVVRISGGQAYKADNSTSGGITAVVGVCNTTVSSGGTVKIDYGFYNSFSSLTAGTIYYIGTSGAITSTKPSLYPVEIGRAVSATRINLNFREDDKPTGTIIATALTAAPKGYIECDGSAVSRTTHARLFGELGVIYGNGDGSSTFNLPDYRGRFLRGFDNTAGTDPDASSRTDRGDGTTGDAVGTKQLDAMQGHHHTQTHTNANFQFTNTPSTGSTNGGYLDGSNTAGTRPSPTFHHLATDPYTDGTNGTPRTSSETRSKNINVMYCIKL
jgi:microcystin-dependent protein